MLILVLGSMNFACSVHLKTTRLKRPITFGFYLHHPFVKLICKYFQ